jgi:hypothetical protein
MIRIMHLDDMLLEYPSFREWYRGSNVGDAGGLQTGGELASTGSPSHKTPEEQIETAHLALQSALREELLQRILQNSLRAGSAATSFRLRRQQQKVTPRS